MPTGTPTGMPTGTPTGTPTGMPTGTPTGMPTGTPTGMPTGIPTGIPTGMPTGMPTVPMGQQTNQPGASSNTFAAKRRKVLGNLGTAVNSRWTSVGGARGLALGALKTGAKVYGKGATMATMGALGLGCGIVGNDMKNMLEGLGAGLTAGYVTGGRLNKATENVGNSALGSFVKDVWYGDQREKQDYINAYMSNKENRNRLIAKNPNAKTHQINDMLRQRAEMSYDSGISDAKMLDRATKLKKALDTQNPNGAQGPNGTPGINYDKTLAYMQLADRYDSTTFTDATKNARAQQALSQQLETSMRSSFVGPIDAKTDAKLKANASNQARETLANIKTLKGL